MSVQTFAEVHLIVVEIFTDRCRVAHRLFSHLQYATVNRKYCTCCAHYFFCSIVELFLAMYKVQVAHSNKEVAGVAIEC